MPTEVLLVGEKGGLGLMQWGLMDITRSYTWCTGLRRSKRVAVRSRNIEFEVVISFSLPVKSSGLTSVLLL
ncbi:hypothetical protein SKAU_G00198710 [Synaphobranchus kaupii]|uniref:Uncharacterized protein n=1 Tax=Synaphobranchus kaupii TaxID=118154 RepID=A0A9Q1FFC0_SYNKA|nr:hypothetical protein SKAU_G00198710 [Synaphobranchus kaupii]